MRDIRLTVPGRPQTYSIFVGNDILLPRVHELLNLSQYSKLFVVTNKNLERTWLRKLQTAVPGIAGQTVLPDGEKSKNIVSIQKIWSGMMKAGCDRKSLVLVLGGGVVGDMGAFAASTYMRGVAYAQIPTTLLAMVDSSIGGKTGFDFNGIKNIIGSIAEPRAVLVDTDTLNTLPERELIAGYAEMLKYGLVKDTLFLDRLAQKRPTAMSGDELADLIASAIRIKVAVVENDEHESAGRKIVNFGHTIGHAIEALSWESQKPLHHGEAIAIGMVIESDLSRHAGFITDENMQYIRRVIEAAGLPVRSPHFELEQMWEKIMRDKKNEYGAVLFTLLKQIGHAVINQKVDENIVNQAIMDNMETQ